MAGNPLTDVREWILAVASGLVGAVVFASIQTAFRLHQWRRLRISRLGELWTELLWLVLNCTQHHWAPQSDGHERGMFAAHASQLREIQTLELRPGAGIDPALLSPEQTVVVRDHLPGMLSLMPSITELLGTFIVDFRDVWTADQLEHMMEAQVALKRFQQWKPAARFAPGMAAMEVSNAVELGLKAIVALNWLSIIVEDGLPGGTLASLRERHGLL